MSWFEALTGFVESEQAVRRRLRLDGTRLHSDANRRSWEAGSLTVPSLGELRADAEAAFGVTGPARLSLSEVIGSATHLHQDPDNAGAVFQVASQANLLEMVGPGVTPEAGVTGYEHDHTQGPACAIACGGGTIVRNWFVEVDGGVGQSADRQIDTFADLGVAIGNEDGRWWTMHNGYAMPTGELPDDLPATHPLLQVGVHAGTEVTVGGVGHLVTKVYCSALPIAYSPVDGAAIEPLARLVLNSAYEATFAAAACNLAGGGTDRLFLTMLGRAFGTDVAWIIDAIRSAVERWRHVPLDVRVVSYSGPSAAVATLLRDYS